jgi:hypothetical protein
VQNLPWEKTKTISSEEYHSLNVRLPSPEMELPAKKAVAAVYGYRPTILLQIIFK